MKIQVSENRLRLIVNQLLSEALDLTNFLQRMTPADVSSSKGQVITLINFLFFNEKSSDEKTQGSKQNLTPEFNPQYYYDALNEGTLSGRLLNSLFSEFMQQRFGPFLYDPIKKDSLQTAAFVDNLDAIIRSYGWTLAIPDLIEFLDRKLKNSNLYKDPTAANAPVTPFEVQTYKLEDKQGDKPTVADEQYVQRVLAAGAAYDSQVDYTTDQLFNVASTLGDNAAIIVDAIQAPFGIPGTRSDLIPDVITRGELKDIANVMIDTYEKPVSYMGYNKPQASCYALVQTVNRSLQGGGYAESGLRNLGSAVSVAALTLLTMQLAPASRLLSAGAAAAYDLQVARSAAEASLKKAEQIAATRKDIPAFTRIAQLREEIAALDKEANTLGQGAISAVETRAAAGLDDISAIRAEAARLRDISGNQSEFETARKAFEDERNRIFELLKQGYGTEATFTDGQTQALLARARDAAEASIQANNPRVYEILTRQGSFMKPPPIDAADAAKLRSGQLEKLEAAVSADSRARGEEAGVATTRARKATKETELGTVESDPSVAAVIKADEDVVALRQRLATQDQELARILSFHDSNGVFSVRQAAQNIAERGKFYIAGRMFSSVLLTYAASATLASIKSTFSSNALTKNDKQALAEYLTSAFNSAQTPTSISLPGYEGSFPIAVFGDWSGGTQPMPNVLASKLEGWTPKDIPFITGSTKSAALRSLAQAVKKFAEESVSPSGVTAAAYNQLKTALSTAKGELDAPPAPDATQAPAKG